MRKGRSTDHRCRIDNYDNLILITDKSVAVRNW